LRVAEERRRERGMAHIEFREGDARSLRSERFFDAAVGRFVLTFMSDPTAALRGIASGVRPGGIVAFHEWTARSASASATEHPVLSALQDLLVAAFARSGARVEIGSELHARMRDAGLEPDPRPLAEVAVCVGQGSVAYRRWALFAQSVLPKLV